VFAVAYGVCELIAGLNQGEFGSKGDAAEESLLCAFHIAYGLASIALAIGAADRLGTFVIVTSATTLLSEVALRGREASTFRLLLYESSHILSAIVLMFADQPENTAFGTVVKDDAELNRLID
jgi:hypothetical protein